MAIFFTNASVYKGQGSFDEAATLVIQGGKIRSVGKTVVPKTAKHAALPLLHEAYQAWLNGPFTPVGQRPSAPNLGDLVIDCAGLRIYPGLLDPHTHIGCFEDGIGQLGYHGNEYTDPNTAHLNIKDSINPADIAIPDAAAGGVTCVGIFPGSANLIGGMCIAAKLYGRTIDEMLVNETQGMKMALGENPFRVYGGQNKSPGTRFACAAGVRDAFEEARHYMQRKAAWEKKKQADRDKEPFKRSIKLENIAGALRGEYPVRYHAHRADDIYTAIRLCKEYGVTLILEHTTEGHKLTELLAREGLKCDVGPTLTDRSKYELRERTPKTLGILYKAGVHVSLSTDHPVIPLQYITLQAAVAVKEGLPEDAAVDVMTINTAKTMGLESRVGSLAARKDADFFITDGDILDPRHHVLATFIDGFCVHLLKGVG
jgi:imidazolonepropionase-like amidohydrolase